MNKMWLAVRRWALRITDRLVDMIVFDEVLDLPNNEVAIRFHIVENEYGWMVGEEKNTKIGDFCYKAFISYGNKLVNPTVYEFALPRKEIKIECNEEFKHSWTTDFISSGWAKFNKQILRKFGLGMTEDDFLRYAREWQKPQLETAGALDGAV